MTPDDLLRHLESLLFVSSEPAEIAQLAAALDVPVSDIESAIDEFAERCKWRGIRVQRKGQRVQLASSPDAAPYVEKYLGLNAVTRLSQAALETLAIIAYRQPITRPEIEVLRGVDCDGVLRTLTARQLIVEVGRLDTVGHPIRYGTTFEFLRYFGLERLDQLPSLNTFEPPLVAVANHDRGVAFEPGLAGTRPEELSTDEHKDAAGVEAPGSDAFEGAQQTNPHATVESESAVTVAPGTSGDREVDALAETFHAATGRASYSSGATTDPEHGDAEQDAHSGRAEPASGGGARSEIIATAGAPEHAGPEPSGSAAQAGPRLEASVAESEPTPEPPGRGGS
jgi:segregation and condensation protein B